MPQAASSIRIRCTKSFAVPARGADRVHEETRRRRSSSATRFACSSCWRRSARFGKAGAFAPKLTTIRSKAASRRRLDVEIEVTVDHADSLWHGHVGVVTKLIDRAAFDPDHTVAFVCGPEIMMRFTATALEAAGVAPERTYLSLERNMKCAVGQCGHCQFGPTLVCRDGAVMRYDRVRPLLMVREL